MMGIYKALVSPWDNSDARKCAEEDWIEDLGEPGEGGSGGSVKVDVKTHVLSPRKLMDALFQLADRWSA